MFPHSYFLTAPSLHIPCFTLFVWRLFSFLFHFIWFPSHSLPPSLIFLAPSLHSSSLLPLLSLSSPLSSLHPPSPHPTPSSTPPLSPCSDSLNGMVTIDRLKKSHKKKPFRADFWAGIVCHIRYDTVLHTIPYCTLYRILHTIPYTALHVILWTILHTILHTIPHTIPYTSHYTTHYLQHYLFIYSSYMCSLSNHPHLSLSFSCIHSIDIQSLCTPSLPLYSILLLHSWSFATSPSFPYSHLCLFPSIAKVLTSHLLTFFHMCHFSVTPFFYLIILFISIRFYLYTLYTVIYFLTYFFLLLFHFILFHFFSQGSDRSGIQQLRGNS